MSRAVEDKAQERREKAPPLFDLTALQRDAAKRFGWSPKETLGVAESLYEKGLLTYPRTESSCLPDDYRAQPDLVATVAAVLGEIFRPSTKPSECDVAQRIFNSAKVSDHFAIIPTAKLCPAVGRSLTSLPLPLRTSPNRRSLRSW